jgi:hypothetical protein
MLAQWKYVHFEGFAFSESASVGAFSFRFGDDMIAATEIAMRNACCWHHDDFLFETQFPTADQPKESPVIVELSANSANEFKERIITRIRSTRQTTYQAPSDSASWQAEFVRIFKLYYWPF